MNYLRKIRNWFIGDFLKKEGIKIYQKHKIILVYNVLLTYIIMSIISMILLTTFGSFSFIGYYIYPLVLNITLISILKYTNNIKLVAILFVVGTWIPTPLFIYLQGDPFLTNVAWFIVMSLLVFFLLGVKWGIYSIIFGLLNYCYSWYVVIQNKGVDFSNYVITDYISGFIDTMFILVIMCFIVIHYMKFNIDATKSINKKNNKLQTQYGIIHQQNEDKANLLMEVHHRVKNNLQMINSMIQMQSRSVEDGLSKEILSKVQQRILTMAKLHEKIYQSDTFEIRDVKKYIEALVADLFKVNNNHNVSYEIDVEKGISYNNETILYIGLLINELVVNALKHAFIENDGRVTISLKKEGDKIYTLKIIDNGIGFKVDEFNKLTNGSLGHRLLYSFTRQLNGKISIESNSEGSVFTIRFRGGFL